MHTHTHFNLIYFYVLVIGEKKTSGTKPCSQNETFVVDFIWNLFQCLQEIHQLKVTVLVCVRVCWCVYVRACAFFFAVVSKLLFELFILLNE